MYAVPRYGDIEAACVKAPAASSSMPAARNELPDASEAQSDKISGHEAPDSQISNRTEPETTARDKESTDGDVCFSGEHLAAAVRILMFTTHKHTHTHGRSDLAFL